MHIECLFHAERLLQSIIIIIVVIVVIVIIVITFMRPVMLMIFRMPVLMMFMHMRMMPAVTVAIGTVTIVPIPTMTVDAVIERMVMTGIRTDTHLYQNTFPSMPVIPAVIIAHIIHSAAGGMCYLQRNAHITPVSSTKPVVPGQLPVGYFIFTT